MQVNSGIEIKQLNLNDPLRSFEFLVESMGFEPVDTHHKKGREVLIKNRTGNYFKLSLKPCACREEPILIFSDDCLSDYFDLKTTGIKFNSGPQYVADGLIADFKDASGNYYRLLEKRIYEEDEE